MRQWKVLLALAATAVVVATAVAVLGPDIHAHVTEFENWLRTAGWGGPVVFVIAFVALTTVFVPDSVVSIAAGALFGFVGGAIAALVGSSSSYLSA